MSDDIAPLTEGNAGSKISFTTVDNSTGKICIIEWNNVGFYSGQSTDYANFQIRLYENTNIIQYHYGTSSISPDAYDNGQGPTVTLMGGLLFSEETADLEYFLTGAPTDPSIQILTSSDDEPEGLLADIPANTLYTFKPEVSVSVSNLSDNQAISISPNPAHDIIHINQENDTNILSYEIISMDGKLIERFNTQENKLSISHLVNGMYTLRINTDQGSFFKKIIKK